MFVYVTPPVPQTVTITLSSGLLLSSPVTTPATYVAGPPSPITYSVSGLDGPSCNKIILPVCTPPRLGLNVTVNSVSSSPSTVLLAKVAAKTGLSLTTLLTTIATDPMLDSNTDSDAGVVGGVPIVGGVLSSNVSNPNTNTLVFAIS